jgi:hypothetical protein
MMFEESETWKAIPKLYKKPFTLYVSLREHIQDNEFPDSNNVDNFNWNIPHKKFA